MKYLKAVESCQDPRLLEEVPRKWEPFDTELSSAVRGIATGSLKRKLLNIQERFHMTGSVLSGRLALWHLYGQYIVERGQASQVELTQLLAHQFDGDLSIYLDGLDAILLSFHKEPDEDLLLTLVEPQLRKC